MSDLQALCEKERVRCKSRYLGLGSFPSDTKKERDMRHFKVTLHYQGRQYTTDFYQGLGWEVDPTTADVLSCIVSDAISFENARSFEDWASDFGYDADSRSAERVYKACKKQAPKVRQLLGESFEQFASAEH